MGAAMSSALAVSMVHMFLVASVMFGAEPDEKQHLSKDEDVACRSLYSSVAERQSCKLKVLGSIPSGGWDPDFFLRRWEAPYGFRFH